MMEEDALKGLDNLVVWKQTIQFAEDVLKRLLPLFPSEERYALSSQLRRAAQSIPANIAEGYGRFYYQEGIRFCYISHGSLEEVYSHISLANRLGYVPVEVMREYNLKIVDLRKLLKWIYCLSKA